MKALVNQRTGEVYWENDWLPWINRTTGLPLALRSRGYAYCAEATSESAADYIVSEVREEDDDGYEVVRLVAVQRAEE